MTAAKHELTRDDVIAMADYARERKTRRRALVEAKRHRRLAVGPDCTFYFENYETMWNQVHEMLFIEKGGEDQIADELRAYNPLVPKGRELVATVMFEIDEPVRREALLAKLGGVEETAFLRVGGETIAGRARGRRGAHQRGRQGLLGPVHPLPLHRPTGGDVPLRQRRDRGRLHPSRIRPHGGPARTRAPGAGRGFRLRGRVNLPLTSQGRTPRPWP